MKCKLKTDRFFLMLKPGYFILAAILTGVLLILPFHLLAQEKKFDLEGSLEVKEMAALGEAVKVKFNLFNKTDEPLIVLKWQTPLEGIIGEIFSVKRNGKEVPYYGILVKRGAPLPQEYVTIDPRGFVSNEVDLTSSYDLSQPGDYTIEFISPSFSHVVKKESAKAKTLRKLGPVAMPSNVATVKIIKNGGGVIPDDSPATTWNQKNPKPSPKHDIVYIGCSSEEKNIVKDADAAAQLNVTAVFAQLDGLTPTQTQNYQLYLTWFGAYTAARFSKVLENYGKIKDAFLNKKITYNCHGSLCEDNWYAYVYKGGDIEVFLCPLFWSSPDSGTDTKYGTLIHEVSHEAADTDDYAYGMTNCENLATSNPDDAVDNADNYLYFSEHYKWDIGVPDLMIYSLLLILFIFITVGVQRYFKYRKTQA